jgi:hypothetical protein
LLFTAAGSFLGDINRHFTAGGVENGIDQVSAPATPVSRESRQRAAVA